MIIKVIFYSIFLSFVLLGLSLSLLLGLLFYVKIIYIPNNILKTGIKESELIDKNYILCQTVKVTGFDWFCIKDEDGNELKEYCHIVGPDPFKTFAFSYNFEMADNIFIFYVKEKRRYYSEEILEDILEYAVTEWDILYPVKQSDIPILNLFTKKYLTKIALWDP